MKRGRRGVSTIKGTLVTRGRRRTATKRGIETMTAKMRETRRGDVTHTQAH